MFPSFRASARAVALTLLAVLSVVPAHAQTDFMNTDRGRPLTVEDALAVERWGLEVQVAPLRLERNRGGSYQWGMEPSFTAGLLPRTEFEVGLPFAMSDAAGVRTTGLAGVDLAMLHQLNNESDALPAMALRVATLLPAGPLGPTRTYTTVTALATRSFDAGVRLHANALYTAGQANASATGPSNAGPGALELARWMAGVSLDRTWALSATLVGIEATVREPLLQPGQREWSVGVGTRFQVDPRWLMDLGVGHRSGAGSDSWYATVGGAVAIGWRWGSIMGGR